MKMQTLSNTKLATVIYKPVVLARICYKVDISNKLFAIQCLFKFLEHFQAYLELELGQQIWQWWTQARLTSSKWALRAHLELAVGWTHARLTSSKCALRAHLELAVEWKQANLIIFTNFYASEVQFYSLKKIFKLVHVTFFINWNKS